MYLFCYNFVLYNFKYYLLKHTILSELQQLMFKLWIKLKYSFGYMSKAY